MAVVAEGELFDTDGVTSLTFNDDFDGLDSRINYNIAADGDYFSAVRAFNNGGGPGQTYTINFDIIMPGPGDPTTVFASGFTGPGGMAVDDVGQHAGLWQRRANRAGSREAGGHADDSQRRRRRDPTDDQPR